MVLSAAARKPSTMAVVNTTAFRFKSDQTLDKPLEKKVVDKLADPKESCKFFFLQQKHKYFDQS
jgi:hypothetical protein